MMDNTPKKERTKWLTVVALLAAALAAIGLVPPGIVPLVEPLGDALGL